EDGTEIVCSGDHRFLSDRGWKHVIGSESGPLQRPHLAVNDRLIAAACRTERDRSVDRDPIEDLIPLRVVAIERLGVDLPMYDITTGTGDFIANGVVSHNCFARPTHDYLGLGIGEDFERIIVVKINAIERLRTELVPS